MQPTKRKIVHVIGPYTGTLPLRERQNLFLESVDRARRPNVVLLAARTDAWHHHSWESILLKRTASILGEPSDKPFLKDLCDLALERTGPDDWILYSNVDCALSPDFYENLLERRATVVEYQRQDVEGNPRTLGELFSNPRKAFPSGVDGIAIRSSYYAEIRDFLPDFVLGEPHWDTVYSGIFRKLVPVQRDTVRLFHPKHEQMWDLAKPNAAGQHNQRLFVDALSRGYAEKTMITETADSTDTAVVIPVFGNNPSRVEANTTGIWKQLEQDLYADFFLVELLVESAQSSYSPDLLSRVKHLPVRTSEACLDLFQKEALLNYGWRVAQQRKQYNYFIFPDADVYAAESSWLRHVRARLQEDPSRIVQGWRTVRDTIDPHLHFSSIGAAFRLNQQTDLPLNPGICWALHRALLEMGDGLNPYCLGCGGDSAFVAEYLNTAQMQYDPWLYQWNWFREIERKLPFHGQLDCVPVDLIHVHHGFMNERNYDGYRHTLDQLRPLSELVRLNADGMLEWRDPECVERRILRERQSMGSEDQIEELLRRFSYVPYRRPKPPRNGVRPKTLFRLPEQERRSLAAVPPTHDVPGLSGLKVFDPEQVFRKDFPFSWCDGIAKPEGSTYIPIVDTEEFAVLVMEGRPETRCVVCALPLQPNWLPTDIRLFRELQFAINVQSPAPKDILVTLVSQFKDGSERSSTGLSISSYGIQAGQWVEISIALDQFSGTEFDLSSVRLIKFTAYESCSFRLARIYFANECRSRRSG